MTKVLVLYHSMYGHIETLAGAVAEGAREAGAQVDVKRVPETMPEEAFKAAGGKWDQEAPVATPADLEDYDAIVIGTGTRFGNMTGQMRTFLDQTGAQWAGGKLIGKVGSVFTSTGTGTGGESTILSTHITLLHHGLVVVGLPFAAAELTMIDEVRGGSAYGAATLAGPDGSRQPSAVELEGAHYQGRHVAQIAAKLSA